MVPWVSVVFMVPGPRGSSAIRTCAASWCYFQDSWKCIACIAGLPG